ncbi:MAG: hypothetical protein K2W94_04930 [Alphaproteobacteria bacterium]|nr:hypothetical protein [Alphaproteobacteria bacterium]
MCTRYFLHPFIKIKFFYDLVLIIIAIGFSNQTYGSCSGCSCQIGSLECPGTIRECFIQTRLCFKPCCPVFCCSSEDPDDNKNTGTNSTYSTPVTSQPTSPVDSSTQDRTSLQAFQKMPAGYEKLKRGKLIYKPNPDNDVGRIEIPFSDLLNPLEGTFDLSRYGDAGKYISIETGYRKEKKADNVTKMEIWIVPRFIVENSPETTAQYFKYLINSGLWRSEIPIGIFWNKGSWNMDLTSSPSSSNPSYYLTTQSLDELSNDQSLLEKWKSTWGNDPSSFPKEENIKRCMSSFYLSFR